MLLHDTYAPVHVREKERDTERELINYYGKLE